MKLSLVICTYVRPEPLRQLLLSVYEQTRIPNEIIIVDGSPDNATELMLHELAKSHPTEIVSYTSVPPERRGLTRQRAVGIAQATGDIYSFLDDDIVLFSAYFERVLEVFACDAERQIGGVGGYPINESAWRSKSTEDGEPHQLAAEPLDLRRSLSGCVTPKQNGPRLDSADFTMEIPLRWRVYQKLRRIKEWLPGKYPSEGHPHPWLFLPPDAGVVEVDHFYGGISSFRRQVFEVEQFSTHFEGNGVYDDMHFCLRVKKRYRLLARSDAWVNHLHDLGGRTNFINRGTDVIRYAHYIWRENNPHPSARDSFLFWFHEFFFAGTLLWRNILKERNKGYALEFLGRCRGGIQLGRAFFHRHFNSLLTGGAPFLKH